MSNELIVEFCSPTLAGLKTGNLFSAAYDGDCHRINEEIRSLNRILTPKGLRAVPVRYGKKRVLVYVYRPGRLQRDMENRETRRILSNFGYTLEGSERTVAELVSKVRGTRDFPHEIGLFLGYPPEDVAGFMEHPHSGCKCVGYWKVYGDVEAAEKTFRRYRRCTDIYRQQLHKGKTLDQLTVREAV